jgi:hypothetical protein
MKKLADKAQVKFYCQNTEVALLSINFLLVRNYINSILYMLHFKETVLNFFNHLKSKSNATFNTKFSTNFL